jgi:hypothetical protein
MNNTLLRRTLLATAAAVIALCLAGCGDDKVDAAIDSAPASASVDDFCEVWNDDHVAADATSEEYADSLHEAAQKLAQVGTPEAVGDSERHGFETFVAVMSAIDADDVEQLQGAAGPEDLADAFGLTAHEGRDLTAFLTYTATACA